MGWGRRSHIKGAAKDVKGEAQKRGERRGSRERWPAESSTSGGSPSQSASSSTISTSQLIGPPSEPGEDSLPQTAAVRNHQWPLSLCPHLFSVLILLVLPEPVASGLTWSSVKLSSLSFCFYSPFPVLLLLKVYTLLWLPFPLRPFHVCVSWGGALGPSFAPFATSFLHRA